MTMNLYIRDGRTSLYFPSVGAVAKYPIAEAPERPAIQIAIADSSTVNDIWDRLAESTIYRPAHQTLYHESKLLFGGTKVLSYGIRPGSVLEITPNETKRAPTQKSESSTAQVSPVAMPSGSRQTFAREFYGEKSLWWPDSAKRLDTRSLMTVETTEHPATLAVRQRNERARKGGYDANTHIVDPDSHFAHLKALQTEVIESAAFSHNDIPELLEGHCQVEDLQISSEKIGALPASTSNALIEIL